MVQDSLKPKEVRHIQTNLFWEGFLFSSWKGWRGPPELPLGGFPQRSSRNMASDADQDEFPERPDGVEGPEEPPHLERPVEGPSGSGLNQPPSPPDLPALIPIIPRFDENGHEIPWWRDPAPAAPPPGVWPATDATSPRPSGRPLQPKRSTAPASGPCRSLTHSGRPDRQRVP